MAAVRFAFIGCGNIARFHLRALRESTHLAEVTTVVDVRRESAEKFSSLLRSPCKVGGANTSSTPRPHNHGEYSRLPYTPPLPHMQCNTATRYSHHCLTPSSGESLMQQCSWFLTISTSPALYSAWRLANMFCWKSPWHTHWTLVGDCWQQQRAVTVCSWLERTHHTGLRLSRQRS